MVLSVLEVIKFVFISMIRFITAASAIIYLIVIGTPCIIYGTWLRALVQPIRDIFSQLLISDYNRPMDIKKT